MMMVGMINPNRKCFVHSIILDHHDNSMMQIETESLKPFEGEKTGK